MAKVSSKNKTPKTSKKGVRKQVAQKLTKALGELETEMGKKRFRKSVKKASKLFKVKPVKKQGKTKPKKAAVVKVVKSEPAEAKA
jgi:hypothetical protein